MLSAIIVAAGNSQRMGFDKLFAPLGGRPVVAHTLEVFDQTKCVDEIILVGHHDRLAELNDLVRRDGFKKVRHIIPGGIHRQDSVQTGLNLLAAEVSHVAVHDAARPLVTSIWIDRVLTACQAHGGAALAEPVTDTLKRSDENLFVTGSVDREYLYRMQTPQIFRRELLVGAYQLVAKEKLMITDEVSAIQHLGEKVVLVPNEEFNIKITYPRDLLLAQSFLERKTK
jgi:2-C-methyl-D-erythritol 4-phosphate cytidylyltransferase